MDMMSKWAKLTQVKVGDKVQIDAGFSCCDSGIVVIHNDDDDLYFLCQHGRHYLAGQAAAEENLVGIYREVICL